MRKLTNQRLWTAAALMAAAFFPQVAHAADAGDPMAGATLLSSSADTSQYLGSPYRAEAKGFNFSPPWGAVITEKAQGTSRNLIEFQINGKQWVGDVQHLTLDSKLSLGDYAKSVADDLRGRVPALQVLEQKPAKLGEHPALRVTMSMLGDAAMSGKGGAGARPAPATPASLLSQQFIVQMLPGQFFVLEMYTPLKDRDEATRVFDAMTAEFEVFDPAALQKKHGEAVLLGKKWLDTLSAEQMKPKLNNQIQVFRMIVGKNDVGFVTFEEAEVDQIGRKGLQEVVHSKSFLDDGGVLLGDNMAFWAYAHNERGETLLHYSMWENISKRESNLVIKGRMTPKENWLQETGALNVEAKSPRTPEEIAQLEDERRKIMEKYPDRDPPPPIEASVPQYRLHISLSGDANQHFFQNLAEAHDNVLDVPIPENAPAPLPKFLEYTWTRMVDLKKPSEMSFWSFNSRAQRLSLRTLIVTGKTEHLTINGVPQDCWRCVDEMDPGSTVILVDNDGRIVSMRSSDGTVFVPTTKPEMQRRWATRLGQ